MTFAEFTTHTKMRSAWLREPGLSIYVRRSFWPTRDYELANVSADEPGAGAFTRFLERFEPRFLLYVEVVSTRRLIEYLERRGYHCVYCAGACSCELPPNMIGPMPAQRAAAI